MVLGYRPSSGFATQPISRRGFLRAGVATSLALAGAGAISGCLPGPDYGRAVGTEHPEVLSTKQLAILTAFAGRVITPADGGPTAIDARIARRIDRELAFSDGRLADDVGAALTLIEHGTLLDFRFRRFTSLAPDQQDAYLVACARSTWTTRRNAYAGLRFLCLFFYYTDDRTWQAIGYNGPTVDRKLPEAANAIESLDRPLGATA
jgi:hypothetical protein